MQVKLAMINKIKFKFINVAPLEKQNLNIIMIYVHIK